ncbi:MAG: DUF3034 family protein [Pseudomonadota bacterium]
MKVRSLLKISLLSAAFTLFSASHTFADSRILATGGASTIEGAAGGGIVPWAVLAGYGSGDEWGTAAFSTQLRIEDYSLDTVGAAVSYNNRIELSYARQNFDLGTLGDALGMPGHRFRQDVFGMKYRLAGDLIFNRMPQITLGLQHKKHLDFAVPTAVGALRDSDNEIYLSAAKLWLAGLFDRNVFLNVTGRYSRANQAGLLGFGGDLNDDKELLLEASTGLFLTRKLALGVEYREHAENLGFSAQDDWHDVFVGYFVNKHLSLVGAFADLGTVATLPDQKGWYMSFAFAY